MKFRVSQRSQRLFLMPRRYLSPRDGGANRSKMQKVKLAKIEISKLQSRVKCSWFLPSLRWPQDPNPMAYRHLDSVYATGPLDIAAHTRTGPLVRAPDLMGIRRVRTAAAPELIPGEALPSSKVEIFAGKSRTDRPSTSRSPSSSQRRSCKAGVSPFAAS